VEAEAEVEVVEVLSKKKKKSDEADIDEEEEVSGAGGAKSVPKRIEYFVDKNMKILDICCGDSHAMCLVEYHYSSVNKHSNCYSWGRNSFGQLGSGDTVDQPVPAEILMLKGIEIVGIACGNLFSVVWSTKGKSFSFGQNNDHQLGTNSKDWEENTPAINGSLKDKFVYNVKCGKSHVFVLAKEMSLYSDDTEQESIELSQDSLALASSMEEEDNDESKNNLTDTNTSNNNVNHKKEKEEKKKKKEKGKEKEKEKEKDTKKKKEKEKVKEEKKKGKKKVSETSSSDSSDSSSSDSSSDTNTSSSSEYEQYDVERLLDRRKKKWCH